MPVVVRERSRSVSDVVVEGWDAAAPAGSVPSRVARTLDRFGAGVEPVLLVRRVPVGVPPVTPASPTDATDKDDVSEQALASVAALLGDRVGYAPEHGGDLVQNLVPTRDGATRQVSTSSSVLLELHTEAAFHPHRPRFLLLLCLRGDPAAGTTYASAASVAALLHPATRAMLAADRFTTGVDESYVEGGAGARWRTDPHPVLWQDAAGRWCCRFDVALTEGVDGDARAALAAMAAATRCALKTVVLSPGDLLVLDNLRVVHGRTPFTARFDGTDRWLQRSFVVEDLAAVPPSDRVGSIVTTRFA